jgi:hypothetical protein
MAGLLFLNTFNINILLYRTGPRLETTSVAISIRESIARELDVPTSATTTAN